MVQKNNKILRAAIIGCGSIAGNHIRGILDAEGEVVALCDIVKEKAKALLDKYALSAGIYENYLAMLDDLHPDVVHICTPHVLHAEMIIEALKRDISVLCEKPLCISFAQMQDIIKAKNESKAQLGICLQNRYDSNILRLKSFLQDKTIVDATGIVLWNRDEKYYAQGAWRGTKAEEGGGVMINQALHTLDLLQWIAGKPDTVIAHIANDHLQGVIEVEDTAMALFEFRNDNKRLHFYASTSALADYPTQLQFVYKDENNVTHSVFADYEKIVVDHKIMQIDEETKKLEGKKVWGTGHSLLIRDFYQCLLHHQPFAISLEDAIPVISMILGMYASDGKTTNIFYPSL